MNEKTSTIAELQAKLISVQDESGYAKAQLSKVEQQVLQSAGTLAAKDNVIE